MSFIMPTASNFLRRGIGRPRLSHIVLVMALGSSGCATDPRDFARQPALSAVGSGLLADRVALPAEPPATPVYRSGNSIWQGTSAGIFRDSRAHKIGDIVTVRISINDRATIDNNSRRSRDATTSFEPNLDYDVDVGPLRATGSGSINGEVESRSSTDSRGGVNRSENIDLLIAALVTGVLPNGNLVVSGSQEVRVNFEVRELSVAGIVRPGDISTDNTIAYDKVAEARISYGGRGRITEVQQPAFGQQLFDLLTPF